MSRAAAVVVLNPAAGRGRGERRWLRVCSEVEERFEVSVVRLDEAGSWRDGLGAALDSGFRTVIAAGGDGTVHAVVEALAERSGGPSLSELTFGAVGLGSSNDFQKPYRRLRCGVPFRIDASAGTLRDIARVSFDDVTGRDRETVLVVSGSVGVVAEANVLFNESRCRFVGAGIAFSALRAIARHRPMRATLRHEGEEERVSLSSLSFLKTPWLSGALRFDTAVAPDDGALLVTMCEGMGRARLIGTLAGLAAGRFAGPGTRTFRSSWLELSADAPFLLELDGEVSMARAVRVAVLPERIRLCA